MAAMTVRVIGAAGSVFSLVGPPASGDTIAGEMVGDRGLILDVNSPSAAITVAVSDPGATPAGNPGTVTAVSVGSGQRKQIYIGPANVNKATNVVTLTYTGTLTAVTAEAYRY